MTPFPGTPLFDRLLQQGRILDDRGWERCTLFDINFQPQQMSVSELRAGFRELGTKPYADAFVREQGKRFIEQLRAGGRRERRSAA